MERLKVSFIKFDETMIGSYVHLGGIATGVVVSTPYLNGWGETRVSVIWDNDWEMRFRGELAMVLMIKKPGKDKSILRYLDDLAGN